MNFNIDDPLADLLSDNSADNDSFFENPTGINRKPKNPSAKIKGKLEDLFGIKEETESDTPFKAVTAGAGRQNVDSKSMAASTPRITKQKPSLSTDNEDYDDDLGFDPKKPKAGLKTNLFDDLLGAVETKRPATAKPAISRQSTDTTTENSNLYLTQARPKTSTGRRSSGNSAIVNTDPLGLFGGGTASGRDDKLNASTSGMSTPKAKKRGNTADWLGLNVEADESTLDRRDERLETTDKAAKTTVKPATPAAKNTVEIIKIADDTDMPAFEYNQEATNPEAVDTTAHNVILLNNMQMEARNSYNVLQQQESQLVLTAQMKNQERALLEMQRKQAKLLQHQEQQFQLLLQKQIHRQQQMEEHIKQQQHRINAHLQMLLMQPTIAAELPDEKQTINGVLEQEATTIKNHTETITQPTLIEVVQLEADVKRLELEKLRLEEILETIKTNYEKEIDMIESSYKKQLQVLEEHFNAYERRSKSELEELNQYYSKKLKTLETVNENFKAERDTEITEIKREYKEELSNIRKSHEEDMQLLKEEHHRMLENIRQSKMLEFAAVQENGSYLEVLRLASNNLENLSGGLQELRDDMQAKIELLNKEREQKLEIRERKLENAEKRLQLNEQTAEDEKRRLMELVATLELQLGKLSKESAEENWLMRQQMAAIEAEKQAFQKEKEFEREQLARDEKRIADLKDLQFAEAKKTMLDLQEQRAQLLVERTKIETEKMLQPQTDLEKERLEVETALKVAQDATRQADAERNRYAKLQRQLEQQKRSLLDKEHMLQSKEDEVEQELSSFRIAERKSQEMEQKARLIEQNFQMKITALQQRMRELGEKEANLAHERMLLTQERIAMQNMKTKLSERKCTLCQMSEQNREITQMLNNSGNIDDAVSAAIAATGNANIANVTDNVNAQYHSIVGQTNIVERLLDENIAESYRKMKTMNVNAETWPESVLDDDSKELALHNLDNDFQYGSSYDSLNRRNLSRKF